LNNTVFCTRLFISSAMCIAICAMPAAAQTLREALTEAYRTNPVLTGARAGQRVIDENVPLAKAQGRPNAQAQATYTENVYNSSSAQTFTNARSIAIGPAVQVPLYSGGAVKNAVRAAETRVGAGRANLRATESSLFSAVVGAYMDVIRDEAVVSLNRAQVGVLDVNLQATRDRFEIGDLTRTDVAQSEARLATAISGMEQARAQLIRSKETYIQLVGSPAGELEAPPPLPNLPGTPDAAVEISLANNPDLQSAQVQRACPWWARLPAVITVTRWDHHGSTGPPTMWIKAKPRPSLEYARPYHCIKAANLRHVSAKRRHG
jgi:outer membrane protein